MIGVNAIGVLAAAIASTIIGSLWFGPLFGKQWMKLMGFTAKSMKAMRMKPVTAMLLGLVMQLLSALVLSVIMSIAGIYGAVEGAMVGALVAAGFVITKEADTILWEGKEARLFILQASYRLVSYMVMGAAIGFVV